MFELYEQLMPTRLYASQKTLTGPGGGVTYRLCGSAPESVPHISSGCKAPAQNKYLFRNNAVLKVLFFQILRDLDLVEVVPPWYSPTMPKPMYESEDVLTFWDVPVIYSQNTRKSERID